MTAGKFMLNFLDVKGLLYSKLMPTAQLWLVKHQESWNYDSDFIILDHSTYCPNLALSDFFIFPKLKQHFKGPYYTSDDEVKTAVRLLFHHQDAHVYQERHTKLLEHWNTGRSVYSIKMIMWRNRCAEVNYKVQEVSILILFK